jgi:hypothetical protein
VVAGAGSESEYPNCATFFGDLDFDGQALFILGGPVDGRTPEAVIDATSRAYVDFAWTQRCAQLEAGATEPIITDLTAPHSSTQQSNTHAV